LFPIAWTTLYIASAYAAARIAMQDGNALAMAFWAFQIACNTLWSPVFFGLKRLGVAMGVLVALWVGVLGTLVTFFALDQTAGLLIAPYLVWVSYAGALNFWIWRKN
jgi:tryptophan-rich sensory protein